jgi:Zn-dependent membrane protease YugP
MLPLSDLFKATGTMFEGLPEALGIIALVVLPLIIGFIIKFCLQIVFRVNNLRSEALPRPAREVAERALYTNHITCRIRPKNGLLTDCYDADENTLWLSNAVYYGQSPVSYAIALHEVAHAIQHKEGYKPEVLRTSFGGLTVFFALAGILGTAIGFLFAQWGYVLGLIGISLYLLISILTVRSEINASRRARAILETLDMPEDELRHCKTLLSMCYWTYIVTVVSTLSALVLLLLLTSSSKRKA